MLSFKQVDAVLIKYKICIGKSIFKLLTVENLVLWCYVMIHHKTFTPFSFTYHSVLEVYFDSTKLLTDSNNVFVDFIKVFLRFYQL